VYIFFCISFCIHFCISFSIYIKTYINIRKLYKLSCVLYFVGRWTIISKVADLNKELHLLENKALVLKRIRNITNECLCNGAYSNKNEHEQIKQLETVKTPQWEIEIIGNAVSFKRKLAHGLLKELDMTIDKYKDIIM